jgi:class 3 adenylate cyclase
LRTLTFLFTAFEDGAAATARHDALLRDVTTRHAGQASCIVEGAFCVAFPEARAAVRAAVDAQRALCAPENAGIGVRMGLRSGTVDDGVDGGPTLARGARVAAAAQGRQILLTAATVALLDRTAPPGCEWRDLGDHTLRGFAGDDVRRRHGLRGPGQAIAAALGARAEGDTPRSR